VADLITVTPPTRAGVAIPRRQHVSPNPPPAAVLDSKSGISGSRHQAHMGIMPRRRPTDSSALLLRPFGVGFTASSFQTDAPSGCSLMAAYTASTAPTAHSSAQHADESQIKSVHPMFPQLDVQSVSATGGQDSGKYLHGACSIKLVGQAKARLRSLENVCPGGRLESPGRRQPMIPVLPKAPILFNLHAA
jgi:hypothetical protein